ncbi:C25 family cysteine peptidase [Bacteroidales bacterium OttesenSCG-928-L14]|nr:C25 family cysteine peptidase [Bacteroidales bacterium OttesenSCG-928-L14]
MKKPLFIIPLIFNFLFIINLTAQNISYSNLRDGNGISVSMTMDSYDISTLNHKGEEMHELFVSGISIPNDEGMPNLPRISRFIALPQGADAKLFIKNIETEVVSNVNMAPALRVQAENEEPEFNYSKNKRVYDKNEFYPTSPVEISERTSLRGVDAIVLGITPFQYNPVTKELIVIKNIELEINYEGGNSIVGDSKYRSRWFDPILKNALLNYEDLPEIDYSEIVANRSKDATGCEYLIVTPNNDIWAPYAEQLKEYRTKQGILTKIMRLDEMGVTTTDQLKSYFHNAYNTWDIPPVAVLLMADHKTDMTQGIPAEVIYHPYNGSCITDNQYADVNGNYLPEMVFARMTAENEQHLQIMVSKTLEYEYTNPCVDTEYYNKPITALGWQTVRWFQICSEAVGGYFRSTGKNPVRINEIYEGTPGSVWSTAQNTNSVVNYFGVNGLGYLPASPTELGNWSGGTAAQIVTAINNGAFVIQHRDHGYVDGWGEPSFSSSDIQNLNNVGKMTFVFSINCETGKFNNNSQCFSEVFHRRTFNGQNAGAVGVLSPTEVSYSFVNDTYIWGVYDLFEPDFMPTYGPFAGNSGNWMPAFGNVAGKYFLQQSSWPYNSDSKQITYQMFTAHCDAFLQLFSEVPTEMEISHQEDVMTGLPLFVTCEEDAVVALTIDEEIIAVFNGTGSQQEIELPILEPETMISIVATKQNRLRYVNNVRIIPASGPYIICNEWTINDENNNGKLDYAETSGLSLTIKNIGADSCSDVVATLVIDDEYITVEQSNAEFGNLNVNDIITTDNAFSIKIANNVPNNYKFTANVLIECSEGINWNVKSEFIAYAPIIEFVGFDISGEVLPGEYLSFNINLSADYNFACEAEVEILIDQCNKSIKDFPWEEDFEISTSLDCWTQESDNSNIKWIANNGGLAYKPNAAHSGSVNMLIAGYNEVKTKLISPSINIPEEYIATLSFWHAQTERSGRQDILRVYYKTSIVNDWILIEEFTDNYPEWEQFSIDLPETSNTANYYIAFESEVNGAYGVVVDDISISLRFNPCMSVINLNAEYNVNSVDLSWELPEHSDNILGYDVYCNDILLDRVTTNEYKHSNIPYQNNIKYCVTSIYDFCTATTKCYDLFTCVEPRNLTIDLIENNLVLQWEGASDVEYFNIYKNEVLIATNHTETNYSYFEGETGKYTYKVTAVYPNCIESEGVELQYSVEGINNISEQIKIYPNPANDFINIEAKEMSKILIYNSIGQLLKLYEVNNHHTIIDVSMFDSGIYYLQIQRENNYSITSKIIITK